MKFSYLWNSDDLIVLFSVNIRDRQTDREATITTTFQLLCCFILSDSLYPPLKKKKKSKSVLTRHSQRKRKKQINKLGWEPSLWHVG